VTNPFRVFMCGKSFQYYPILIPCSILFSLPVANAKTVVVIIIQSVKDPQPSVAVYCCYRTVYRPLQVASCYVFYGHANWKLWFCINVIFYVSSILLSLHYLSSYFLLSIYLFVTSLQSLLFFFFLIISLFFYLYHLSCLFPHSHVISGFLIWHFIKYLKMVRLF
jgi:hypothetical protein